MKKEHSFVLATFNARIDCDAPPHDWASRAPHYCDIVLRNHFDIFGMQEPNKRQVDDVIAITKFVSIGGGRDDFKDAGEFSNIVYNPARFECLKNGTFGLSEHPEIPGFRSWESACPRIATWGLFRDKQTDREFIYYNTHLDHRSENARINGIRQLVGHAKVHAAGKPLIITGDFNAYPDSETYRTAAGLLHDAFMISKTPPAGPEFTFHNWGQTEERGPIDYIFVSGEFQVLSARTDDTKPSGQYASDHYPRLAELIL